MTIKGGGATFPLLRRTAEPGRATPQNRSREPAETAEDDASLLLGKGRGVREKQGIREEQGGGGKLPCPVHPGETRNRCPRVRTPGVDRFVVAQRASRPVFSRRSPGAGPARWGMLSPVAAAKPFDRRAPLPAAPRALLSGLWMSFRPSGAGRPRPETDATRAGRVPNLDARSFRILSPGVAPGFGCRPVPRSVHIFRASRPKTFFTPTRAPRTEFP